MKTKTTMRLFSIGAFTTTAIFLASCGEKGEPEANGAANTEAVTGTLETETEKQDTVDSLTDEFLVQVNRFADALISAKDTDAAHNAVKTLSEVADAIAEIAARMDKLETPDEATRARIFEKMMPAYAAVEEKLMRNMEPIMNNEELANIIGPPLMDFQDVKMPSHGKVFGRFGMFKEPPARKTSGQQAPAREAPAPAGEEQG